MAATIVTTTYPLKKGSPPDFGTLYSGRALDFDGVSDYVHNSSFYGHQSSTGTISCWVNADSFSANQYLLTVGGTSSTGASRALALLTDGSTFNNVNFVGYSANEDTGVDLVAGVWYHLVCTWSGTSVVVYVNGVAYAHTKGTLVTPTGTEVTIGANYDQEDWFNGKIANAQVWNATLSAAEVQYSYTHPEKFAYDTPASSLTASNLVAWYPMTEGNPRTPQTTVYDGSPRELGSEMVTNGGFDSATTGWTGSNATLSSDSGGQSGNMITVANSTTAQGYARNTSALTTVVGRVYKFTVYFKKGTATSGNIGIGTSTGGQQLFEKSSLTDADWTQHIGYFTATTTTTYIRLMNNSTPYWHTSFFDTVSIKEVKMGNHGTTTFYGEMSDLLNSDQKAFFANLLDDDDNLFDFNGQNGDSGLTLVDVGDDPDHGFAATNCTFAMTGNVGRLTNNSSNQGIVTLPIATVANRTYQVLFEIPGGNSNINVSLGTDAAYNGSNASANQDDGTGKSLATAYVANDTTSFLALQLVSSTDTEYCDIDNLKVVEVGVVAGWTTADAEPLIPQTALMGMSKPMVFDGVDDYVKVDSAIGDLGSAVSISMWIRRGSLTSDGAYLFEARGDGAGGVGYAYFSAGSADFAAAAGDEYVDGALGDTVSAGGWHHVAITGMTVNIDEDIRFGARYNGSQFFDGEINEISLWNKTLSLAEVQELFNDGVALDATTHSASPSTGTDNLVGYWRNDGISTWTDRSQNSNNGTPAGSPVTELLPQGTTAGKDILGFPLTHVNNGWLNLATADYVEISDNDTLDIGTGGFTIEFWIKTTTTVESAILMKGAYGGGGLRYIATVNSSANKVRFSLDDNSVQITFDSSTSVNTGAWFHIAMVSLRTSHIIYVNGSSDATDSTDCTGTLVNAQNFRIGMATDGTGGFEGDLDEVKFYNKVLSATEITKNYNHGKSKHS